MALLFNNTTIAPSYTVKYNSTAAQAVKFNNTLVWQRKPDYLFNNGNQHTEWTGGWAATGGSVIAHYAGWDGRNNGRAAVTSTAMTFNTAAWAADPSNWYRGCDCNTVNAVDLSGVTTLRAQANVSIQSQYAYVIMAVCNWPGGTIYTTSIKELVNTGTSVTWDMDVSSIASGVVYAGVYTSGNVYFTCTIPTIQCL